MNAETRLAAVVRGIEEQGVRCLVMGGHAARYFGVDRSTLDYDLHPALGDAGWRDLDALVRAIPALAGTEPVEGPTWRPSAFRRFVVGTLPDGREERLEFWRRNHLLAPFDELWSRHEEGLYGGARLAFLSIDDLIRSKETEREDDWRDVALLEEIADERRLARGHAGNALPGLRSRRGFEQALAAGLLADVSLVTAALEQARHPVTAALLLPFAPGASLRPEVAAGHEVIAVALRKVLPASARHLALVEAVRRLCRRAAMAADRADKQAAAREP